LANIDDELINALIQPDQFGVIGKNAPIKGVVGLKIKDYKTEEIIGEKRIADILLSVIWDSQERPIVVEVENDREFDVGEILRKIKKDQPFPVIVIIPKMYERFTWRFQNSGINVVYWAAKCNWLCQKCNSKTTTTSSIKPRCSKCKAQDLLWLGVEDVRFEKVDNNPPLFK
jgi:hypothetical protein